MLTINRKLTPYNYTAMSNKQNLYIVIHYVGGVSTAKNNADYYARQKLSASASYFVDEGSIWQSVEDFDRAWHCGGGLQGSKGHAFYKLCTNSNSIGIEMCCKKTADGVWYFEEATIKNTADLTRYLMKRYNIPAERVIRHYDVTGKCCPEPYVRDEKAWAEFKEMITEGEETEMTNEERTKFNEMVKIVSELAERNKVYSRLEDVPQWAKPTIQRLMNNGSIEGDESGGLSLDMNMLRTLVILDREGTFDK